MHARPHMRAHSHTICGRAERRSPPPAQISGRDPGDGGSGSDAFAIENGRQIVVDRSLFTGVGSDGVDVKGTQVRCGRPAIRSLLGMPPVSCGLFVRCLEGGG